VINIKLIIQYDGTDFSGYELQPGKRTIRGEIEKALFKLYKKKIVVVSSSRTDAGVHALQNVINFKINQKIPVDRIPPALNRILPDDIRVLKAEEKGASFDSRFDAKSKEYEYLIYNGEILSPLLRNSVWHVKPKLNISAMRKAARLLIGKQDFSSFCASNSDDNDFVRTLKNIEIRKSKIEIWDSCKLSVVSCKFKGDGFLYKMVRNMVGTLVDVGWGKKTPEQVRMILQGKDRCLAGRTAPSQGLCLVKVLY
jgi:tRNA pseudouridine38-40 synthase